MIDDSSCPIANGSSSPCFDVVGTFGDLQSHTIMEKEIGAKDASKKIAKAGEAALQPNEITKSLPQIALLSEKVASLQDAPVMSHFSKELLQTIQIELDSRNISLTCRELTPPERALRHKLDQQAIAKYLDAVRKDFTTSFPNGPQSLTDKEADQLIAAKRRLFESTQCVTYEDLGKALQECTQKLNGLLMGQNYAVGYAEEKSQQWIAELALPFMEKTPRHAFKSPALNFAITPDEVKLTDDIDHFVMFDDASYSGMQMAEVLKRLVNQIQELPSSKPRKIYFVILFMSIQAKQELQATWADLLKEAHTETPEKLASLQELCIITSDKKLTSFSDVFPANSQAIIDLKNFDRQQLERDIFKEDPTDLPPQHDEIMGFFEKYFDSLSETYLAFTEWKIPALIPCGLIGNSPYFISGHGPTFDFLTLNILPPYKAPPAK